MDGYARLEVILHTTTAKMYKAVCAIKARHDEVTDCDAFHSTAASSKGLRHVAKLGSSNLTILISKGI